MTLRDDLVKYVAETFAFNWDTRNGYTVPESNELRLANDAVKLHATVLYADMADSTGLVDGYQPWFAAEIYKSFLYCAARYIQSEGGTVTAYDGDRVMAVYLGVGQESAAVRTALKIKSAVDFVINPARLARYPDNKYVLRHKLGIDKSDLFVARTGARGANDLVWVGRAANHAAKMAAFSEGYATYVTSEVYDALLPALKARPSDGASIWERRTWRATGRLVYRSNWWWD